MEESSVMLIKAGGDREPLLRFRSIGVYKYGVGVGLIMGKESRGRME